MPTITIRNEYHGTAATTSIYEVDSDTQVRVTRATRRTLCWSADCACKTGIVTATDDPRVLVGATAQYDRGLRPSELTLGRPRTVDARPVWISLSADLLARLDAEAKRTGRNRSECVREALAEWLGAGTEEAQATGRSAEASGDLGLVAFGGSWAGSS